MPRTDLDEYSGEPLTVTENRKMRRLLEQDERAHWFWSSSRIWIGMIAGAIITFMTIANGLPDFIKRWFVK